MSGEGEGGAKGFKPRMNDRKKNEINKNWNMRNKSKFWMKKE